MKLSRIHNIKYRIDNVFNFSNKSLFAKSLINIIILKKYFFCDGSHKQWPSPHIRTFTNNLFTICKLKIVNSY